MTLTSLSIQFVLALATGPLSYAAPADSLWHGSGKCDTPTSPFCDSAMAPIPGWTGPIFKMSQSYPINNTQPDPAPWLKFDPRADSDRYIRAVLQYFFEGNIHPNPESSFEPFANKIRRWFHAPWQSVGLNGREFIHGMTRERTSRPRELHPNQTRAWNNYAVGFYNARGALTIGRVWADHSKPNPAMARFPEGTVAAKLLFTTATPQEVPYLAGSPEWSAYIFSNPNDPNPGPASPKSVQRVRLLQIDIAVRDSRVNGTTGWVFGTFVYGGGLANTPGAGWANVAPVGVMWGNDPGFGGAGSLKETVLNPAVKLPHVGFQGRLNGPVDNPNSSCLSCHATAEYPAGVMIPPQGTNPSAWFRNIPSGQPFDPGRLALDYSLQLSVGITNFMAEVAVAKARTPQEAFNIRKEIERNFLPPRDGGPHH